MDLKLQVFYDGALYDYAAEFMSEPRIRQDATSRQLKMGDVAVTLDSDTFLGQSIPFDIPAQDEGIRARLYTTNRLSQQIILFNGVIDTEDISLALPEETWAIRLIDRAPDIAMKRLEEQPVVATKTPIAMNVSIVTEVLWEKSSNRDSTSETAFQAGRITKTARDWWDVNYMWLHTIATIDSLSVDYGNLERMSGGFLVFRILRDMDYLDGGVEKTYTKTTRMLMIEPGTSHDATAPDIPNWTGKQLFEVLSKMFGWRWRASYVEFPSEEVVLELLPDLWAGDADADIDVTNDLVTEALGKPAAARLGYRRAEAPDFAVQTGNRVNEVGLIRGISGSSFGGSYPPESAAVYAHPSGKRLLDEEGKGENRNLLEVPVKIAHYTDESDSGSYTPDATNHPNYDETLKIVTPVVEEGAVWMIEFEDDITISGITSPGKPIAYATNGSPQTGGHQRMSACYAAQFFRNYSMLRSPWRTLQIKVDMGQKQSIVWPPRIGTPVTGIKYDGISWLLAGWDLYAHKLIADLLLFYPAKTLSTISSVLEVAPPTQFNACIDASAAVPPDEAFQDQHDNRLTWTLASGGIETVTGYEIQMQQEPTYPNWTALTTVGAATSFYLHATAPGSSGSSPFAYRIRSTTASTAVSRWVYAVALILC